MHKMAFAAGFAFAVGLGGATTVQAGVLDFIFGWRDRTDVQRAAPAPRAHPDVTVSHRSGQRKVATRRTDARKSPPRGAKVAKAARPVQSLTPAEQLARTIDPSKNPLWHLEDQTLRKGDILVLNDRVVVFTGGKLGSPKSYVALNRSKLLTRAERARIASMTGGRDGSSAVASTTPDKPRRYRAAFRLRAADRS